MHSNMGVVKEQEVLSLFSKACLALIIMRNTSLSLTAPKLPSSIPEGEWLSSVFSTIVILRRSERMKQQVTLTRQAIRTPCAAAVAGIIFSVLFTTSMVLISVKHDRTWDFIQPCLTEMSRTLHM